MSQAFRIHAEDNVATLLADAEPGPIVVRGTEAAASVTAAESISLGHKVALGAIPEGGPVIKFGVQIGVAVRPITPGEWVHLHNCRSRFDQRSGDFDTVTGEARDTRYA